MDTDKLLVELSMLASQHDPETKQKIIDIKNTLQALLHATPDDGLSIRPQDIMQSQNILPEVRDLVEIIKSKLINNSNGTYLNIKQKTIVQARQEKNPGKSFSCSWLDAMERIFRSYGRKVEYDRPGYNESYDANFTFSVKK